jgi:peptidoglycan/LPS O-acetylase OafA/YrhL
MAAREYYIDRLRTAMTALVVLHHTAITYGASGGWFYYELRPSGAASSLLLTMFCAINQAFFMGFFFLLAGYFTPPSLKKKGYLRYLADRNLRLGVPLLFFILVLGPLTAALAEWGRGGSFAGTWVWLWEHKQIINGPLWFAEALLIFATLYCAWRAAWGRRPEEDERGPRPVPGNSRWWLAAIGVGAAAWTIRLAVPTGVNIFGMQLGYFASYIFLFAVGIAAWWHDWLRQLEWRQARRWLRVTALALVGLVVALKLGDTHRGSGASGFGGGLSWQAVFYAMWEPLVAWGAIAGLLVLFRERLNRPSAVWEWLGRRAFAVYIIHPPVLVGAALVLHGWAAPALLKFAVAGTLACAACWLLADPLVRLPGVRRVV